MAEAHAGTPVGLIGIGRMGGAMARTLLRKGQRLIIRDTRTEAWAPLAGAQCRIAASPAEVAAAAEIVLTSLPGPDQVDQVMTGAGGLLGAVRPGAVVVETSTISPDQSRRLAAAFAAEGAAFLDAPVSGGAAGAADGTLAVMVGGAAAAYARVRPLLDQIGSNVYHMGPSGTGSAMKLVIQLVVMTYFAAMQEGVAKNRAAWDELVNRPARSIALVGTAERFM